MSESESDPAEEEREDTIEVLQESGYVALRWDDPREELTFDPSTADALAFNILGASKDAEIIRALHRFATSSGGGLPPGARTLEPPAESGEGE